MMGILDKAGNDRVFGKSRIEALTDGIYAIAMTLLAISLNEPLPRGGISPISDPLLIELVPQIVHYFISFLLLAVFWWSHHERFHAMRSIDRPLIWMNIASLAFVALVPFSTDIVSDDPANLHVAVIFEVNLLLIGILSWWQWYYLSVRPAHVGEHVNATDISRETRQTLIIPILSVLAIAAGIIGFPYGTSLYFLLPVAWFASARGG
ncbi:MAG: DUF1211 domain-containing protein [Methanobacteriota archaeon]|nr:MAG: DUF1211 domain-containing protein [Euryarchaeota archaeon]